MDEKAIYAVYVGLLRAHKGFYNKFPDASAKEKFAAVLNKIICEYNPKFCSRMRKLLWMWFLDSFGGVNGEQIAEYYSDLWHYHRRYINTEMTDDEWEKVVNESEKLCKKYNCDHCHKMIREIILQIDDRCKQQVGA